jgi:hypothetical protein
MKSTMPASGRERDSRLAAISVVTRMVSPSNSGAGNRVSVMPRLPMVVPTVAAVRGRHHPGHDRDRRQARIALAAGCRHRRFHPPPMVVPTVVSLTEMPIISPRVKSEFISGRPHSVSARHDRQHHPGFDPPARRPVLRGFRDRRRAAPSPHHEPGALGDLLAGLRPDLGDGAVRRGGERVLHLHRPAAPSRLRPTRAAACTSRISRSAPCCTIASPAR